MTYRNRIRADLLRAMKERDRATTMTLRSLLAAIDNAEAVEVAAAPIPTLGRSNDVPRKLLTEEDVRQILHEEAGARRAAMADYQRLGHKEAAAALHAEIALIARYTDPAV